jgi:hypothetical protein
MQSRIGNLSRKRRAASAMQILNHLHPPGAAFLEFDSQLFHFSNEVGVGPALLCCL